MRFRLNGLTGTLLAVGFVAVWTAADYITGDLYRGPGRFLLLSGCMMAANALWGYAKDCSRPSSAAPVADAAPPAYPG